MTAIPLSRAALCLDCETIYPLSSPSCPLCGSTAAATLARWLERATQEEVTAWRN